MTSGDEQQGAECRGGILDESSRPANAAPSGPDTRDLSDDEEAELLILLVALAS